MRGEAEAETEEAAPPAAGARRTPYVRAALGGGALQRSLVEHAGARRADLRLDLVRDPCALAELMLDDGDVLVRQLAAHLLGHGSSIGGGASKERVKIG
jgi:hypothetical protein